VFPEERLLIEVLLGKPLRYLERTVWACDNRYYIDGKSKPVSIAKYAEVDCGSISKQLKKYSHDNSENVFLESIARFCNANKGHFDKLTNEAIEFICKESTAYPEENRIISFSGGKDSTAVADLVVRALGNPSLVHVFGNTTLEFPSTLEYASRYRSDNPKAIFKTAINTEQCFYKVAGEIGPPARMMRWCCSMFKTGPISRVFNNLYRNQDILTFYGIRKCESVARSRYNRVEDNAESVKIQKQRVASPIFYWRDIDVWLYILTRELDFNDAYRLGYDRVGCWCCPNNNPRAHFLSSIYLPSLSKEWRNFLLDFAIKIGKPDPEVYVDSGKWKARQGGNGLIAANSVKLRFNNCATEDHAVVFSLERPYSKELESYFCPIGKLAPELGRSLINETVIIDPVTNLPMLSIQPFHEDEYEYSVKIKSLDHSRDAELFRMSKYQVTKYNACRQCLKCESLCKYGAISILGGEYRIDANKCRHCRQCVTDKYLEGGCLMRKYLRTKDTR
jgi:phosphoadenosine phosphosulfate reductase